MVDITEEEAEQYDRQIRLWGLESQKRLRGSTVLVIGIRGFGAEVCKNIILAGVKSITMMDHKRLTEADFFSQFLAPLDKVGQNRATASLESTQILNPMVEVKVDEENPKYKSDEYFTQFNAIVATDCTLNLLLRLDTLCRASKIKFFCGDVYGSYGYMFADLNKYVYAEEKVVKGINKGEKITIKAGVEFCSLKDALEVDWTSGKYMMMLKTLDSTYFLIRVLMNFRKKVRRNPSPYHEINDFKILQKLRQKTLKRLKLPPTVQIKDKELRLVFSQFSPVCGIVGGILGQEVIKALSQFGEPHNNFFLFNPNDISGRIVQLGK